MELTIADSTIHKAMVGIMRDAGHIGKDRRNASQGYNFRGIDDVYNDMHDIMAKWGVFMTTDVLSERSEERQTKSGGVSIYRILTVRITFHHESGSSISSVMVGEGMDSGDKASNKAMSVAQKYAILQAFAIPTEENKDPENDSHSIAPKASPAIVIERIKKAGADDLEKITAEIKGVYHGTDRDLIVKAYQDRVKELQA